MNLKSLKLGIISDAYHYYDLHGNLCTLTLLAHQFEQWADLFEDVLICAPLLHGLPPATHTPYNKKNIKLLSVQAAGGDRIGAKIDLIKKAVGWNVALFHLLKQVDAVHIRCPNNISIPGLFWLAFSKHLCQAVYTGSWCGHPGEALTYRFQRNFLKHFFRGPVAIYGDWPGQSSHIVPSFSPSYYDEDWIQESFQVANRVLRLKELQNDDRTVRLLSVGSLDRNKNQQIIIHAIKLLIDEGLNCQFDLLGDGPTKNSLEILLKELQLENVVKLHGSVPQSVVREFYRQSDFVIQAPYSEGYGKVPIEAFFHGVIPIISDVDMSSQIVGDAERGRSFRQNDPTAIKNHILDFNKQP